MNVNDRVYVVDWNKVYGGSRSINREDNPFKWTTKLYDYSTKDFHTESIYEDNLTQKGTINKREPRKKIGTIHKYLDYVYEIKEIIQHPTKEDETVCLIASTHTDKDWMKCYVQINPLGLSFLHPDDYNKEKKEALKRSFLGKFTHQHIRACNKKPDKFPEDLLEIMYDKNDRVLFGSSMIRGKVKYPYIPGIFMTDGIPYLLGWEISYDGKGNSDLPATVTFTTFDELQKIFLNNKFK